MVGLVEEYVGALWAGGVVYDTAVDKGRARGPEFAFEGVPLEEERERLLRAGGAGEIRSERFDDIAEVTEAAFVANTACGDTFCVGLDGVVLLRELCGRCCSCTVFARPRASEISERGLSFTQFDWA